MKKNPQLRLCVQWGLIWVKSVYISRFPGKKTMVIIMKPDQLRDVSCACFAFVHLLRRIVWKARSGNYYALSITAFPLQILHRYS